jgi:succinate dehydrogenase / fumarate reductase cytochrome b subunit
METAAATPARRSFPLTAKQLMSVLGLVPLGAYVMCHLWTNMYSINGPHGSGGAMGYDDAVVASRANPAMVFLEILGLGLPFLIHIGVGFSLLRKGRPNNGRYNTFRNLKFVLQRLSAIGILFAVGAHVIKARIMPAMDGRVETWDGMHEALSEPITFTVYVLMILGVAYHLANGVWSSSITLGLAVTPKAQKRMEWVSALVFVILLAMGGIAVYGFQPTLFQ